MTLERARLGLLAALAATIPVSIFAAELLLVAAGLVQATIFVKRRAFPRTPLNGPLLALAVWTLLAASFATDPAGSVWESRKLLLFALLYLGVETLASETERERVLAAALLGGLAQGALMLLQRYALGYDTLLRRPPGFLGHYMSAAGVTMALLLLALARLGSGPRLRLRPIDFALPSAVLLAVVVVAFAVARGHAVLVTTRLFVLALAVAALGLAISRDSLARGATAAAACFALPVTAWALVISETRSAWVGAACGIGALAALALLRAPRWAWAVLALGAALVLIVPGGIRSRLTVTDESSRDRYYMWQAGLDMVLERPVFGQGPGMIQGAYPRFRWPEAPNPRQPHLHDNLLQIAAERGLPGLVFFLWWVGVAFLTALREAQRAAAERHGPRWAAAGAVAALSAVFVAGLFEYNLGDSEVLMLVLLLTAVPFATRGVPAPA